MQRWNDGCGHLNDQPAHHPVGNCNPVNIAPLQFGKEADWLASLLANPLGLARRCLSAPAGSIVDLHDLGARIFCTSDSNRGFPWSESKSGSTGTVLMFVPSRSS